MKHIECGHEKADLEARLDEAAARGAADIADDSSGRTAMFLMSLDEFPSDFMADGRNQPSIQSRRFSDPDSGLAV